MKNKTPSTAPEVPKRWEKKSAIKAVVRNPPATLSKANRAEIRNRNLRPRGDSGMDRSERNPTGSIEWEMVAYGRAEPKRQSPENASVHCRDSASVIPNPFMSTT